MPDRGLCPPLWSLWDPPTRGAVKVRVMKSARCRSEWKRRRAARGGRQPRLPGERSGATERGFAGRSAAVLSADEIPPEAGPGENTSSAVVNPSTQRSSLRVKASAAVKHGRATAARAAFGRNANGRGAEEAVWGLWPRCLLSSSAGPAVRAGLGTGWAAEAFPGASQERASPRCGGQEGRRPRTRAARKRTCAPVTQTPNHL